MHQSQSVYLTVLTLWWVGSVLCIIYQKHLIIFTRALIVKCACTWKEHFVIIESALTQAVLPVQIPLLVCTWKEHLVIIDSALTQAVLPVQIPLLLVCTWKEHLVIIESALTQVVLPAQIPLLLVCTWKEHLVIIESALTQAVLPVQIPLLLVCTWNNIWSLLRVHWPKQFYLRRFPSFLIYVAKAGKLCMQRYSLISVLSQTTSTFH